ncbi:MAG: RidA family protein [Schleiferiaceae bacterium]|nr:RidA family protein [Schleiferiaceae bacterium]
MKKIIETPNAPAPIGPYSQAVLAGNTLYVSGQIAINPKNGELKNYNLEIETRQVMANLEAVLSAADMHWKNVVKCSIFLKSMNDFTEVNSIYAEVFKSDPPARETVEVSQLPKDVRVEISCIAIK